jgi:hypothetical protein
MSEITIPIMEADAETNTGTVYSSVAVKKFLKDLGRDKSIPFSFFDRYGDEKVMHYLKSWDFIFDEGTKVLSIKVNSDKVAPVAGKMVVPTIYVKTSYDKKRPYKSENAEKRNVMDIENTVCSYVSDFLITRLNIAKGTEGCSFKGIDSTIKIPK